MVMDCDLQDRPEEIINLYNKAQEGYDVVFARRKNRKDSFLKVLVSKVFYKIYSFASMAIMIRRFAISVSVRDWLLTITVKCVNYTGHLLSM